MDKEKIVRNFVIVFLILFVTWSFYTITMKYISDHEERSYCGIVMEKYVFVSDNHAEYKIIYYCPLIDRNININSTANEYSNTSVGKKVCYELTENDLK